MDLVDATNTDSKSLRRSSSPNRCHAATLAPPSPHAPPRPTPPPRRRHRPPRPPAARPPPPPRPPRAAGAALLAVRRVTHPLHRARSLGGRTLRRLAREERAEKRRRGRRRRHLIERRRRRRGENIGVQLGDGRRGKRRAARHELEEQRAARPAIGLAASWPLRSSTLRRHVEWRAAKRRRARSPGASIRAAQSRRRTGCRRGASRWTGSCRGARRGASRERARARAAGCRAPLRARRRRPAAAHCAMRAARAA